MQYKMVSNSPYRKNLEEQLEPQWPKFSLWNKILASIFGNRELVLKTDNENRQLLQRNCYGLVLTEHGLPVICGCGGSMFLCTDHVQRILNNNGESK